MGHEDVPAEVRALEAELDEAWRGLALFRARRASALRMLFWTYDELWRALSFGPLGTMDPLYVHDQVRRWMDGLRCAARWLFRAPEGDNSADADTAFEALELGAAYEDISDMFAAVGRDQASVILVGDRVVEFRYDTGVDGSDVFRTYEASGELESRSVADLDLHAQLVERFRSSGVHGLIADAAAGRFARSVTPEPAPLDPSWNLGPYSLAEAVEASSRMRGAALIALMQSNEASRLLSMPRAELVSLLAACFGGSDAASAWLADVTIDLAQPRPDIAVTPFVLLGGDIMTSAALLCSTRPERNLIKAVSRFPKGHPRKRAYENLKNGKETRMAAELRELLTPRGWKVVGGWPYSFGGEAGDIDVLLVDPQGEVAAAELKWFVPADGVGEVADDEKELRKGQQQVLRAQRYLASDPARVRTAVGQDVTTLCGLVISRTTVPPMRLGAPDLPAVTTFRWLEEYVAGIADSSIADFRMWLLRDRGKRRTLEYANVEMAVAGTRWRLPAALVSGMPR